MQCTIYHMIITIPGFYVEPQSINQFCAQPADQPEQKKEEEALTVTGFRVHRKITVEVTHYCQETRDLNTQ